MPARNVEVLLAEPRGFCAGVDRAIEIVERALTKFGRPIYVRHEIVHNTFVVNDLKAKGAIFIEELRDVPAGATLVFSAHGVSRAETAAANRVGPAPVAGRPPRSTARGDLPEALLDRYLVERDRQGRPERFFRDHRAAEPMFRDRGRSLVSSHAYPDAIADMLKIARHRGWDQVRVTGDPAFRRGCGSRPRRWGWRCAAIAPASATGRPPARRRPRRNGPIPSWPNVWPGPRSW